MLAAALFDLDGTLLDSNDAHVRAWHDALEEHGYNVAPDRIAIEVGKGGDNLVPDLLGKSAEDKDGDALRTAHDRAFTAIADREGLLPMPGARELIDALRARGLRVALATSSAQAMLEVCERASGIAWRELFDAVVDADAVEHSKPAPDIVSAAVKKLGMSAAECVMFGDTPWDARAAQRAGVVLVGVRCGGNDDRALRCAGSRVVYADPAAITVAATEMLRRASPGTARLDTAALDALMQHALDAAATGDPRIGAVVARGDGELIARAASSRGWCAHAAFEALRAVGDARDTILVTTVEPCVMCIGAALAAAVDTIVYALRAAEDGGTARVEPPIAADTVMPRIIGDVRAADSRALLDAAPSGARPTHTA